MKVVKIEDLSRILAENNIELPSNVAYEIDSCAGEGIVTREKCSVSDKIYAMAMYFIENIRGAMGYAYEYSTGEIHEAAMDSLMADLFVYKEDQLEFHNYALDDGDDDYKWFPTFEAAQQYADEMEESEE